jgi:tellurite resistance protein TerC
LVRGAARAFLADDLTARERPLPTVSRSAIRLAGFWLALALAVGGGLWQWRGPEAGQQYLAGYLIELGLSVDNALLFLLIFARFGVAPREQTRVLFWGVATALVLRIAFILAGVSVIRRFPWVLYLFGGFLLVTGIRLLARRGRDGDRADPANGAVARLCRRLLPMAGQPAAGRFFVRERGRRRATPLFVVLVLIESADFIFALDSLPAVLAVTRSALVAVASNVLAVLALRSLYLVLGGMLPRFHLLKPGLAVILIFIGAKMLAAPWVTVSAAASLAVIGTILAVCLAAGRRAGRPVPL